MGIDDVRLIELPKIKDDSGNLTFVEGQKQIPFDVKRVFYIYDIPCGEDRGAHAHYDLHQFIICLSGSLDVHVDDGVNKRTFTINRPWIGLHIPPMIWASEGNFDTNTVYLVLTSDYYKAESYIREYTDFIKEVNSRG